MGNMAKQKGKRGERELAALLGKILNVSAAPWAQVFVDTQANGGDIVSIPGLSIEVKRHEALNVNMWWRQAERQADDIGALPVLAYRQNRRPWQFCIPAECLVIGSAGYITLGEEVFGDWVHTWVQTQAQIQG